MRHLKIVATLMALALMAVVGAANATASQLYRDTDWALDDTQKVGTNILATLQPGTSAILESTDAKALDTCTGSELELLIENASNVWGSYPKANFAGCGNKMHIIAAGSWEFKNISGSQNGLFVSWNFEITQNSALFGISCIYKSGGVSIGTLKGAVTEKGTATLEINGVFSSGTCGSTRLTATYVITNPPTGLYVGA